MTADEKLQGTTYHIGIIGYPLQHTLSPLMQNSSFEYYGLPYRYEILETDPIHFAESLKSYIENGFVGFNITIPFKETIIPHLHHLSDEAKIIGAVNTVKVDNNELYGYNTDAYGILKTLEPHRDDIANSNVLVLGAGGAARSVIYVLATHFHPLSITVAARNIQRALSLSSLIPKSSDIQFRHIFHTNEDIQFAVMTSRLIVNTTPIGMYPHEQDSPLPSAVELTPKHIVYDVIYRPLKTMLLRHAEAAGATALGGLPMLIYQGAEAFKLWTGKEMPIQHIFQILKKKLEET